MMLFNHDKNSLFAIHKYLLLYYIMLFFVLFCFVIRMKKIQVDEKSN